jgi:four helix bundle protein
MATIKKFEDLEIWQTARELNKKIYPVLIKLDDTRNYKLKNQLDGSAGSVMDNIAEGFDRDGNREFIQFLAISKGSLSEVKSQLYRTLDREIINQNEFDELSQICQSLSNQIGRFMTYLNNSPIRGKKFRPVDNHQPETRNN